MYNAASGWLMTSLDPAPLTVSLVQSEHAADVSCRLRRRLLRRFSHRDAVQWLRGCKAPSAPEWRAQAARSLISFATGFTSGMWSSRARPWQASRRWLDELLADANANAESIAKRERCSIRKVNMTISLAFLAPDLVKAAIAGRLPHGMGVARLADMPAEWSRQHQMLGLPSA